jgi:hypothetical protein
MLTNFSLFGVDNVKVCQVSFPTDHLRLDKSVCKTDYPDVFDGGIAIIFFEQDAAKASYGEDFLSSGATTDPNMATALFIRDCVYSLFAKPKRK